MSSMATMHAYLELGSFVCLRSCFSRDGNTDQYWKEAINIEVARIYSLGMI